MVKARRASCDASTLFDTSSFWQRVRFMATRDTNNPQSRNIPMPLNWRHCQNLPAACADVESRHRGAIPINRSQPMAGVPAWCHRIATRPRQTANGRCNPVSTVQLVVTGDVDLSSGLDAADVDEFINVPLGLDLDEGESQRRSQIARVLPTTP